MPLLLPLPRSDSWCRLGGSYFEASTVTETWSKGWEITAWRMVLKRRALAGSVP